MVLTRPRLVADSQPVHLGGLLWDRLRTEDTVESSEPLPTGKVTLVYDFTYDGGGINKGGTGVLTVNGKKVGEGRINKTMGQLYSLAAETANIGEDAYSPVTKDYDPWDNAFTGTIEKVTISLK